VRARLWEGGSEPSHTVFVFCRKLGQKFNSTFLRS
jgi:hypothetical protein